MKKEELANCQGSIGKGRFGEMRIFMLMFAAFLVFGGTLNGAPDAEDPYDMKLVTTELKMNMKGQRVITSWGQKGLARLGDRASVAILKILEPTELSDPEKVMACLQIIRQAFAQPKFIDFQTDKDPKVTWFLLRHLQGAVSDAATQVEIRHTEEFVREKTATQSSDTANP